MALFNCPECGKQISSTAAACPQCGHPVERDGGRVTTQQTAQHIKAIQAIGLVLVGIGIFGLYNDHNYGVPAAAIGVLLYVGARLAAWWRHG